VLWSVLDESLTELCRSSSILLSITFPAELACRACTLDLPTGWLVVTLILKGLTSVDESASTITSAHVRSLDNTHPDYPSTRSRTLIVLSSKTLNKENQIRMKTNDLYFLNESANYVGNHCSSLHDSFTVQYDKLFHPLLNRVTVIHTQ
jgi:hypothetical protein